MNAPDRLPWKHDNISCVNSQSGRRDHVTWQNLSALSLIKKTWIKGTDLHPCVSYEPLIEDEELIQSPRLIKHINTYVLNDVNHLRVF